MMPPLFDDPLSFYSKSGHGMHVSFCPVNRVPVNAYLSGSPKQILNL